jgi:acetoin utilization deacetylase AcuC-like enzyme
MKNIPIIYSPLHKKHSPKWEIINEEKVAYAEVPERIEQIVKEFRAKGMGDLIQEPQQFSLRYISAVHQTHYIDYVKRISKQEAKKKKDGYFTSFFINDLCAPIVPATYDAAVESVNCALTGTRLLKKQKVVYALCRPPGHHAEKNRMGGYCYFNNAAIAADYLSQRGKVAILDIDFHHGNGTQQIFYERSDVLYVSLHVDPTEGFPYTAGFADEEGSGPGKGYNKNFPLPLGTDEKTYMHILQQALGLIRKYNPTTVVVSCGFDTYEKDPIGGFRLTIPFYEKIARKIISLKLPTLVIQEGGYNIDDLGEIAYSFMKGLDL